MGDRQADRKKEQIKMGKEQREREQQKECREHKRDSMVNLHVLHHHYVIAGIDYTSMSV